MDLDTAKTQSNKHTINYIANESTGVFLSLMMTCQTHTLMLCIQILE